MKESGGQMETSHEVTKSQHVYTLGVRNSSS